MSKSGIRTRLTLAHTLTFGSLLTLWAVIFYLLAAGRLYAHVDEQLSLRHDALRTVLRVSDGQATWLHDRGDPEQFYIASRAGYYFQVFNDYGVFLEGSELARVIPSPFTDAAREALARGEPTFEALVLRERYRLRILNSPLPGPDGRTYLLRVGMLTDEVENTLRQLAVLLGVLVPLVVLTGATTGWWVAGRALEPVAEISATARKITGSSLAQRLPLQGTGDELDQLSATLNEMIARLEQSFEQMSQFLTNVSHELRTPLAALRGSAEVALRTAKTEDEFRRVLRRNVEEMERLAGTVSDLLELARAEAGQITLRRITEDLSELARDAVESMRAVADSHELAVRFEANGAVEAPVDAEHVLRLLINLLDNAIKYNHPGGRIEVSVSRENSWAVISIFNTGRGIAPEEQQRIFERFYRGSGGTGGQPESSGTDSKPESGGAGLGLSLARWVVAAHGGRIDVHSEAGRGATFRVQLPAV